MRYNTESRIALAAGVVFFMCFLPWVATSRVSWVGTDFSWVKLTLSASIFVLIIFFLDQSQRLRHFRQLILVGTIVMLLSIFLFYTEFEGKLFSGHIRWRGRFHSSKGLAIGFYIAVIASIYALYSAVTIHTGKKFIKKVPIKKQAPVRRKKRRR